MLSISHICAVAHEPLFMAYKEDNYFKTLLNGRKGMNKAELAAKIVKDTKNVRSSALAKD